MAFLVNFIDCRAFSFARNLALQILHSRPLSESFSCARRGKSHCSVEIAESGLLQLHLGLLVSGTSSFVTEIEKKSPVMEEFPVQSQRRCSARLKSVPEQKRPYYGSPSKPPNSSPKRIKTSSKVVKKNLHEALARVNLHANGTVDSGLVACCGTEDNGVAEMPSRSDLADDPGKSCHVKVKETLRRFNEHYLHFVQEEEKRCNKGEVNDAKTKGLKSKKVNAHQRDTKGLVKQPDKKKGKGREAGKKGTAKRPDLKAITKMMETQTILYPRKRHGNLPGVDVGHQFYSRAEMVVVGVHAHWLNGIDYMGESYKKLEEYKGFNFPIAVSIVLSGMYEDDLDNSENVVYTGQGGNDLLGNKHQVKDQVLQRGNLALKNSMEHCVPVRVTRGHGSGSSYTGKVYTYDGLYKVVQYWEEKGVSGFNVFKYRLKRLDGQPLLTTNQVQFTRAHAPKSIEEVSGLVCKDISGGQEDIPIPATNLVDDPPVEPMGYTYCKSIQVADNVKLPMSVSGCNCRGDCIDPSICACARLNGTDFPYVHKDGGRLIKAKSVVFECGPNCGCGPGCVNKTSQRGLKYRYEVYRTPKKGWAVRCWDFIPSGAPVCEYIGRVMRTAEIDHLYDNNFIFDIDCLQTMKGLDGREKRLEDDVPITSDTHLEESHEKKTDSVPEFCIDAGSVGNIARFINHSCDPNLFVQCVLSSHHDIQLARIMLFAAENIPPMQELTYDYGYGLDSVLGLDGQIKRMACYCGAPNCRKRLY